MPAYVILFRPDSDVNETYRGLLRDIAAFKPELRGACTCTLPLLHGRSQAGTLYAVSTYADRGFSDLETTLNGFARPADDALGHAEDHDETLSHQTVKSWYANILVWRDDAHPGNETFSFIASEAVGARIRGK